MPDKTFASEILSVDLTKKTMQVQRKQGGTWAYKFRLKDINPEDLQMLKDRQDNNWGMLAVGLFERMEKNLIILKELWM